MIPITKISLPEYGELENDIKEILKSGRLTMGPYQQKFEQEFAKHVDVKHAIAVNSCTDGLTIVMKAMGLAGKIITTPFTYIATVHSIIHAGLKPRFVDIDIDSFNLDPKLVKEELEKDDSISAIVPVHVFGQPCKIEELWKVAKEFDVKIIWDSAHCGGYSQYHTRKIGGFETAEVCSLAPTKLITSGEGGIITTIHDDIADKCRSLARLGLPQNIDFQADERVFTEIGYNARIPEISCVLAYACLKHAEEWGISRAKTVELYRKELDGIVQFQKKEPKTDSANFAFPVIINHRDKIQKILRKKGIETRKIWFSPSVHRMPCYKKYNKLVFPCAESVSSHILCLPLYAFMPEEEILQVCDSLKYAIKEGIKH